MIKKVVDEDITGFTLSNTQYFSKNVVVFSKKMEKHTKMIDANKLRLLFNDDEIIKIRIFCNNYGMNS